MADYSASEEFLGSLFIVILLLILVYYYANRYIKYGIRKHKPDYLQVESSEEEYFDELIPRYTISKDSEKIVKHDSTVYLHFLNQTEARRIKEKSIDNMVEVEKNFNPTLLPTFILNPEPKRKKITVGESAFQTTVGLTLKYKAEENKLSIHFNDVKNIVDESYGGPQRIKFMVKLFNENRSKVVHTQKQEAPYLSMKSLPPPFHFKNINRNLLEYLIIRIKMFGLRKKTFFGREELLGALFIRMKELELSNVAEKSITKAVLPLGTQLR